MSQSEEDHKVLGRQIRTVRGVALVLADILSLTGTPTAVMSAAMERVIAKRRGQAREVLERELAAGQATLEPKILEQVDESAAIILRYMRAADEGARVRNLRLMARAFRKQVEGDRADAGSFYRTTAMIEDLTDEELSLLGGWLAFGYQRSLHEYRTSIGLEIEGEASRELYATAASLLRNGLVLPESAWGGMAYMLSPSAQRLLTDLEAEDFQDAS